MGDFCQRRVAWTASGLDEGDAPLTRLIARPVSPKKDVKNASVIRRGREGPLPPNFSFSDHRQVLCGAPPSPPACSASNFEQVAEMNENGSPSSTARELFDNLIGTEN